MKAIRVIEKKVWPEFFDDLLSGKKKFEIRKDDFEVEEGDILYLREFRVPVIRYGYSGRAVFKKVSYVLRTKDLFGPVGEFVVLGLEDTWVDLAKQGGRNGTL